MDSVLPGSPGVGPPMGSARLQFASVIGAPNCRTSYVTTRPLAASEPSSAGAVHCRRYWLSIPPAQGLALRLDTVAGATTSQRSGPLVPSRTHRAIEGISRPPVAVES